MKHKFIVAALGTAVLLLGSSVSLAASTKAATAQPAASAAASSPKASAAGTKAEAPPPAASTAAKGGKSSKRASSAQAPASAAAPAPLIDINSATAKELKTLPGIGDALAAKIIAGRPYGSKAQLVSRNIIDTGVYEGIKQQIIAKQPSTDAATNAAAQAKKK